MDHKPFTPREVALMMRIEGERNHFGDFKGRTLNAYVTEDTLKCVTELYPTLETLCLNDCINLERIDHITNMKTLTHLYLTRSTKIKDLSPLYKLKNLEYLDIEGCSDLSNDEISKLKLVCPKLRIWF
jgi:Leucine-rich repeat (LRR) protein